MALNLTKKQNDFCQAYIETGNASESYRRAYSAENMSANAVGVDACNLLKKPKVALRIKELRAEAAQRNAVTVDSLVAELEEARQIALTAATPQTGAAVSATLGKAKLVGLDKQVLEVTGKDGAPFIADLVFVRPALVNAIKES